MSSQNKNMLVLGLAFIFVGFLCLLGSVFWLAGMTGFLAEKTESVAQAPVPVPAVAQLSDTTSVPSGEKKHLSYENYLKKARKIYGDEELQRREGTLWTEALVVTLGRVNGALPGKRMNIYDGQILIAEAVVETASDLAGHVKLVGKSPDELKKNYYKAVLEE